MRTSIIDVAFSLVEEGGIPAVAIRTIAERIEYCSRTVYLYFKDKEEILEAVREIGFFELAACLRSAYDADYSADPALFAFERLRRLASTYLRFASARSNLYSLMYLRTPSAPCKLVDNFSLENLDAGRPEMSERENAFAILYRATREFLAPKVTDPAAIRSVAIAFWGMVHGLATLALYKQDQDIGKIDIEVELDAALRILLHA